MSYDRTSGYHSTYGLRTNTPYQQPIAHRHGYTEPRLTTQEHAAIIAGSSAACAVVTVPVVKLEQFYFLSDVPGESSRIFMSDKRAQFFRVLLNTRWWRGRSLLWLTLEYGVLLAIFALTRGWLERAACGPSPLWSNATRGLVAGAASGAVYAALRHPYDVLRATAEAPAGPRAFRGPGDVLWTALREKPRVLLGLYRGFSAALVGRTAQFALQFGLYNGLRYDGVYRHGLVLFLYCHAATFLGMAAQYPVHCLRQQLHILNTTTRGRPQTYRSLLLDLRRRHGITKLYEGFFKGKPFLNAVPMALLMAGYDTCTRRYTEYRNPEAVARPTHTQAITSSVAPAHPTNLPPYEFVRKAL